MPATDDSRFDLDALPFATTLHVRDACLCLHVQRAARVLARTFDEAMRPFGLTNGQFSLLMSLNRPQPPLMGEVAALLAMDRTTLTAMLKPLARRGLLATSEDDRDRRGRRLILTQEGRVLLARAMPAWAQAQAATDAKLGDGGASRLRGDLARLG